jgi:hypothetical protein
VPLPVFRSLFPEFIAPAHGAQTTPGEVQNTLQGNTHALRPHMEQ